MPLAKNIKEIETITNWAPILKFMGVAIAIKLIALISEEWDWDNKTAVAASW